MAGQKRDKGREPFVLLPPTYDFDGPGLEKIPDVLVSVCPVKDGRKPENGLPGFAFALLDLAKKVNAFRHGQLDRHGTPMSALFMRSGPFANAVSLLFDENARLETIRAVRSDLASVNRIMACCVCLMRKIEEDLRYSYNGVPLERFMRDLALLMFLFVRWEWVAEDEEDDPHPFRFWFDFIQPEFAEIADATYAVERGAERRAAASHTNDLRAALEDLPRLAEEFDIAQRRMLHNLPCSQFMERDLLTTGFSPNAERCNFQIATVLLHYVILRKSGDLQDVEDLYCIRSELSPQRRLLNLFESDGAIRRALSIFHATACHTGLIGQLTAVECVRDALCGVLAKFDRYNLPSDIFEAVDAVESASKQYFDGVSRKVADAATSRQRMGWPYDELCRAMDELVVRIGVFDAESTLRKKNGVQKSPRSMSKPSKLSDEALQIMLEVAHNMLSRIYEQQLKSRGDHTTLHNQLKTMSSRLTKIGKDVAVVKGEQLTPGIDEDSKPRGRKRQCPAMRKDALNRLIKSKDKDVERIAQEVFYSKKNYRNRYKSLDSFRVVVRRDWDDYAAKHPSL